MDNNTTLMSCIIALLVFNLFITLYNENPIENSRMIESNFDISSINSSIEEATESSTIFTVFLSLGRFLVNIFVMMFGWFPNFSFIINTVIKIFTYIFVLPIIFIAFDKLRGTGT